MNRILILEPQDEIANERNSVIQQYLYILSILDFAFQPIVNIYTGVCYGYEALLRNYDSIGFESIDEFFDWAFNENILHHVNDFLMLKAAKKFSKIHRVQGKRLFYNLDNRVLEIDSYSLEDSIDIFSRLGLSEDSLCLEISEKYEIRSDFMLNKITKINEQKSFHIVLDDFGAGFANLQLLYNLEPDIIKIDRFFISEIDSDSRKKLFVSNFIQLAHTMSVIVVAEGVETEGEFKICQDIGCDLVQGYFIARPTLDVKIIQHSYNVVKALEKKNRRKIEDFALLKNWISMITPFQMIGSAKSLLNLLKMNNEGIVPVVNEFQEPMGIISKKRIKGYVYTPYGLELLNKQMSDHGIKKIIYKCPTVDIKTEISHILEIFSLKKESEGILITEDGKYLGFLNANSLLNVLNEKNIARAKDQNPLTRLPGNFAIQEYLVNIIQDIERQYTVLYFDIDNFKPFNDKYGFRRGDRVLILLSQLLKEFFSEKNFFIGHIGGDDFFSGFHESPTAMISNYSMDLVRDFIDTFINEVVNLYDDEDIKNGYIWSKNRNNEKKRFPLMSVSVAFLAMQSGKHSYTLDDISFAISDLKKSAKMSSNHVSYATMLNQFEGKHNGVK